MKCGNVFCIYWDEDQCRLDEVGLDHQGQCRSYICVDMDEDCLKEARRALLRRFEEI